MISGLLVSAIAAADGPAEQRYAAGASLFQANCAVCHTATGVGQPGLAPPLTSYPALYARDPEGRRQLVWTVLFGMFGDVVVDERHYNFKMPDFARLDDSDIAAVLNFVVFDLGHAGDGIPPIAAAEVAPERSLALAGDAVRRHRLAVLAAARP